MITLYVIQGKNGFLCMCVCVCVFGVCVILIRKEKKNEMGQLSQSARLKKWISTDYF